MRGFAKWILILALIGAAVWLIPEPGVEEEMKTGVERPVSTLRSAAPELSTVKRDIVLYLADKNRAGLVPTPASLETGEGLSEQVAAAIGRLFENGAAGLFPPETVAREVFVYSDVAVISLDGSFRRKFSGGAWSELLAVYSLVNTIAESFEEINKVKILVDAKEQEVFASHVDIYGEMTPDSSYTLAPAEEASVDGPEPEDES